MSNWVTSLDNLAASGVIDFDAPAFLLGQNPRYVGNPDLGRLPLDDPAYQAHGVTMKNTPNADSFDNSDGKNLVQNPTWKKLLFAAVAIGGTALVAASIISGKGKLNKLLKKIKLPKFSGFTTKIKNFGQKILNYIKKPISWVKGKIRKP